VHCGTAAQRRARTWSIILGAAASVVVLVLVGWGVAHLLSPDSTSPSQQLPSDFPTFKTPTNPAFTTIYSPPTTGTATKGTTKAPRATSPATTASTGSSKP